MVPSRIVRALYRYFVRVLVDPEVKRKLVGDKPVSNMTMDELRIVSELQLEEDRRGVDLSKLAPSGYRPRR